MRDLGIISKMIEVLVDVDISFSLEGVRSATKGHALSIQWLSMNKSSKGKIYFSAPLCNTSNNLPASKILQRP